MFDEYGDLPGADTAFEMVGGGLQEAGTGGGPYYVVASSNNIDPVNIDVNEVEKPGNVDLRNAATQTDTVGFNQVFQHFPEGGPATDLGVRNPLRVCQLEYGCPDN